MIRLFIADDHTIFREGLKQILSEQDDFEIVGEATTGDGLVERISALVCDVVLLDLSMPGRSGIGLVRDVASIGGSRVVVLSMHEERQYVIEAMKAGAVGYVTKASASDQLIETIRKTAAGERVVSPSASQALIRQMLEPEPPHTALSPRERQIFDRLVTGRSVSAIARELDVSIKTVSTHKSNVLLKLDAGTTADLVRYALARGLA
ncbi:response regulator transcription factor [Methylobacterium brachythecii]|uniref:DNA-binding NarL/FixJ family response regulator n=1 Tax=Methylobacterium brachythecii TaxID=1176177 RepID=A0A7W6AK76_9HYPH|nr:response regulator transcription factor [Methylobacterium brachythecii]MBB3903204.1 DNA-binding NarL/FixJ family response regulator [Methylobacterium brachythecii]GLS45983.1 DNA-binding response regulator [Methylobacterium brachythecii]